MGWEMTRPAGCRPPRTPAARWRAVESGHRFRHNFGREQQRRKGSAIDETVILLTHSLHHY